jgi:membrane-associated phospholipid phosphatase
MDALQQLGIRLIQALQTLSPALDGVMHLFSFLGSPDFYLLALSFVYWCVSPSLGIRLFLIVFSTDYFSSVSKHLFHLPRPYWIGGVQGLAAEASYGIPSSHASVSTAFWGYVAARQRKAWLWVLAIALILLISFSRLYLGVHFPHDVVFGWLIGLAILYLFNGLEEPVAPHVHRRSAGRQIAIWLGVSLAMLLLGFAVLALISPFPDPAEWSTFAEASRSPGVYMNAAGGILGGMSGYVLMKRHARFDAGGSGLQKAARYVLGVLTLLLVFKGLDVLFSLIAADETVLGYLLRYLRYTAAAFTTNFCLPWLFLKTRLAEPIS